MENISRNLEKDVAAYSLPVTPKKRKRHWDILFVDDRGKIVSLQGIREIAIALAAVLVLTISATIILSIFSSSNRAENRGLKAALDEITKEFEALRHEKDVMMARLVLAESNNPSSGAVKMKKASNKTEVKSEKVSPPPIERTQKKAEKKVMQVDVKEFAVTHDMKNNVLRVKFIVKNDGRLFRNISGRIFVILKPDLNKQAQWLILPTGALAEGRPYEIDKGQFFKITRYKTVNLLSRNQTDPEKYKFATIFVFTTKGELALKRDVPVKLRILNKPRPKKKTVQQNTQQFSSSQKAAEATAKKSSMVRGEKGPRASKEKGTTVNADKPVNSVFRENQIKSVFNQTKLQTTPDNKPAANKDGTENQASKEATPKPAAQ